MMHFPRRAIAAIRNRAAAARGFVTRNKATAAKPPSAANTLYNSSARSTTHGLQRATGVPATCHVGVATGNFSHPAGCGWGGLGLAPTATQNAATQPLAGGGLGASPCATGNFSLAAATEPATQVAVGDSDAMYRLQRAGVFGGMPTGPTSATVDGMTAVAQ